MRDTSHFQRGSQGEGIVRQFHSCCLEGNRCSKENVPSCHLRFHSRTSRSLSEIRPHFNLGRFVTENHKKLGERGGGECYFQGLGNEKVRLEAPLPSREVCCQASVAGQDL